METHIASKVIIIHPDKDQILLVKRNMDQNSGYEPAGGRVEIDFANKTAENLEQCLIREAYEELGVEIESIKYYGSYYFFWTVKENACTVCAIFVAKAKDISRVKQKGFETGGDIFPVWVEIDDMLDDKILIEQQHVGLLQIIKDVSRDAKKCKHM